MSHIVFEWQEPGAINTNDLTNTWMEYTYGATRETDSIGFLFADGESLWPEIDAWSFVMTYCIII